MIPLSILTQNLISDAKWPPEKCKLRVFHASAPEYGIPASPPSEFIRSILARHGISRLYRHQQEAIQAVTTGKNVLLATPTASGKSLAYQLPTLDILEKNRDATALYLFPFKALARDQAKALRELAPELPILTQRPLVEVLDGDTPQSFRTKIRKTHPSVIISNPDLIHYSILPYHTKWESFLKNLKLIVVDEIHVYRGAFGSHVLQIMRRLNRILHHYDAHPQVIACSATIGNPLELAGNLLEAPFQLIETSGAPTLDKAFISYLPDEQVTTAAVNMFESCLKCGLKTIVFTKSRRYTELIYWYLKRRIPEISTRIAVYRAGFLPQDRREIEEKLFQNRLDGVISTSALELGIDIGGLDCCILVGFPGSVSSFRQRAGRVGRNRQPSIVIFITGPDALDRYYYDHEALIHQSPVEKVVVYKNNEHISDQHLECAADELILVPGVNYPEDDHIRQRLQILSDQFVLLESAEGGQFVSRTSQPHRRMSIRSAGESYEIYQANHGVIGSIDGIRAFKECHPGAIYLHGGKVFKVSCLDQQNYKVTVEPGPDEVYTQSYSSKETEILTAEGTRQLPYATISHGRLRVREKVTHYAIRRIFSGDIVSKQELDLPEMVFETRGIWISFCEELMDHLIPNSLHPMGGLHAIEHALIGLYPLVAICDRSDLAGISTRGHIHTGTAAVFVYDGYPGGLGLAESALDSFSDLLKKTLNHIRECSCVSGCPYCIQSPKCGAGNEPLDKKSAIFLLEHVSGEKEYTMDDQNPCQRGLFDFQIPELPSEEACPSGTELVFDLETQLSADEVGGWKNCHEMRVAIGVVYDIQRDQYEFYAENQIDRLLRRLKNARRIIGFNTERFDFKVLSKYTSMNFHSLPSLDLLRSIEEKLGYRLSLDQIATATLNTSKSADGLQSLKWWKDGRIDLVAEYCKKDVEVTYRVYAFGVSNGHILCPHRSGQKCKIPVSWRMPE